jgi:Emfourin
MTQISFERSGGFMGRKVSLQLSLEELPASQSETLQRLLDEADFFNLPENLITSPLPDEFVYTITVEAGTRKRTIRVSDTSASESLRPLLEELSRRARSGRVNK